MAIAATSNFGVSGFGDDRVGRHLRVAGALVAEKALAVRDAVTAIVDNYVSDDIIIDLRDVSMMDERSIAMLTSAGAHARELGHRVVVQANGQVSTALDAAARSGALVVID